MDTDHLTQTLAARTHLKAVLRDAFRAQNRADIAAILGAHDTLLAAEIEAARLTWRAELMRDRTHEIATARAKRDTAENLKAARRIRGEPEPRTCTNCGGKEGDEGFEGFYNDAKRIRPWCRTCEKKAGRERSRRAPAAEEPVKPERRLAAVV